MPGLAAIMLWGWPLVALVLFATLEFRKAAILTVVLGYLLMPSHYGFDFPMLPPIDKHFMAGFAAILGAMVFAKRADPAHSLPGWLPRSRTFWILMALIVIGAAITVMTNESRLVYEGRNRIRIQSGLLPYDGISDLIGVLVILMPFFVARRYLADSDGHRLLLLIIAGAALAYTLPALWEIRMSPQLHKTIYGFHGGQWRQNLRGSAFRPYVFLNHGLPLSVFFAMGTLSCFALWRFLPRARRGTYLLAGLWIFLTLLLSRSLGSTLIAVVLGPVVLFFGHRNQLITAAVITVVFLTYPITRANGIFPADQLVSFAESISTRRAESLAFRFENEDMLLERAAKRPIAGWGGYGRSRVINEKGMDVSVTDGGWIITLGEGGWMRFVGKFGLFTLPILIMIWRRYQLHPATIGVIMVLMVPLINLLPNSHISPIVWLFVGALVGRLELGRVEAAADAESREAAPQAIGKNARPAKPPGQYGTSGPVLTRQTSRHVRGSS